MFRFLRRRTVEEILRHELRDVLCARISATARVAYWQNQESFLVREAARLNGEIGQQGGEVATPQASVRVPGEAEQSAGEPARGWSGHPSAAVCP